MKLSYYTPTDKWGKATTHKCDIMSYSMRDGVRINCTFKTDLGMIVTMTREEIEQLYNGINRQ